ncbi:hypothetical protein F5I97DRAFT_1816323 [Phlebopus sp. FC_14]|nr:hypothetical protein F5I97DRAFT_1816323 [Phlebopus sp. FC_14]
MSDTTPDRAQRSSPTIPALSLSTDHVVPLPLDSPPTDSVTENSESTPSVTPAPATQSPVVPDSSTPHVIVPIPTPSANNSLPSVAFSQAVISESEWGAPPPEIATADISIAPDGSFIETSSGPAARELKRRYDQSYGVGKDVRSPYMITAIINQHGKQVYRVGYRDATVPAAEEELKTREVPTSGEASHSRSTRGRPRMSVHNILMQNKSKAGTALKPPQAQEVAAPARKLIRRTRSIPDMFGVAASAAAGPSRQATSTGRTHSHSVTGADMPRAPAGPLPEVPKLPTCDIFGEAMHWPNGFIPPSPCASGSASGHSETGFIPYPFGPGLSFDSPSRQPDAHFLPMPRALREMQSFESGLTARAGDTMQRTDSPDFKLDPLPDSPHPDSPPPRLAVSPFADDSNIPPADSALAPLPETSMHSRYSPEVFDILQTYRGLPLLDRLVLDSAGETTIRMSLRADDSAAPRDDPRFVLWGEMQASSESEADNVSLSQSSHTGMSSSPNSRKKASVDMPTLRISADDDDDDPGSPSGNRKVLVAATIERWIAQLTSELNYDELLNFFLTYRTYISATDLCHLLICRFHWSLSGHATKQDEMVRKIVRVRTFVAIRYWLLTFFVMDFLPNRELRLLLASWLNTLVRDPVLKKHQDGLSIVRKLIKVVKDCKEAHTRRRRGSTSARQSISNPPKPRRTHVLGEKFAEATSTNRDDSDVDLDFVPDDRMRMSVFLGNDEPGKPGNAFSFGSAGAVSSPPRGGPITSASAAILQQPLQRSILQQSRASISVTPGTDPLATPGPAPITIPQSALSRAFVKTIGRLGRWKRVLNSRQTVDTGIAVPANVSAFDLELSASGDLLTVRGGVEQYLKMIQPSSPVTTAYGTSDTEALSSTLSEKVPLDNPQAEELKAVVSSPQHLRSVKEVTEEEEGTNAAKTGNRHDSHRSSVSAASRSVRTHSTESFGSVLSSKSRLNPLVAQVQAQPPWRFDVVSIDDLDLSDTSSDVHVEKRSAPPGLRKAPRKLPLRRDFEFVRRSRESVSSMGIQSRDSVASESSAVSVGGGLGANIQQWQVNAIVDSLSDDDGDGGVEEALQRLEGQINPQRRKEKALKVDGWVRAIQERMAAGDFGDERPRFYSEDGENEDEEFELDQRETGSVRRSSQVVRDSLPAAASQITISEVSEDYFGPAAVDSSTAPTTVTPTLEGSIGSSVPTSPRGEAKPAPEDVVPLEILQSRVSSRPSTSHGSPLAPSRGQSIASPPKMLAPAGRKSYRCWILNVSADSLVQHFSMIDRELFLGIKPEELIMDDWMSCREVSVLDWAQYLKDRARWKAESRFSQKTSALAAVRGRFNLIANFVVSEIVLTHPNDRHTLVAKFIRTAIKAYSYSNFNTLVAILAGLRNEWVNKAMHRHWSRVGPWEMQIFQKLSRFVIAEDDFKAMHQAITAMVDAKPLDVRSHASTVLSNSTSDSQSRRKSNDNKIPSACVPFIGVYLSQLCRYSKLPDLIDPTSPHTPVGIDSSTVSFDSPSHPEVFECLTPLPPSMQLEPLINVHKQRLIAGVIKELVGGQHLASRMNFPIDKKLFQKCLKIRGLDSGTLQQAFMMYS